jgi:ribose transport system ATP-binding protein
MRIDVRQERAGERPDERTPSVQTRLLMKTFGTTRALRGVDFSARPAEIVALIGHNGAGKSTLLRCIGGFMPPTSGELTIDGRPVGSASVQAARSFGVRSVRQELSLPTSLSAAECARLADRHAFGGWRATATAAVAVADLYREMYGQAMPSPRRLLATCDFSQRQMIEVCLAFLNYQHGCRLVILDEATSAMGADVTARLFDWIGDVARRCQITILITTHRLSEVVGFADRAVVMAEGAVVAELSAGEITEPRLVELMGGAAIGAAAARAASAADAGRGPARGSQAAAAADRDAADDGPAGSRVLLNLDHAAFPPAIGSATLKVRAGEIVGIGGLEGHGQPELLHGIFGRRGVISSRQPDGESETVRVGFVSGDTRREGIFPFWSVRWNVSLGGRRSLNRAGFVATARERASVEEQIRRLRVRGRASQLVSELSGGNQQKVVLARAMMRDPDLYLLNDPTRGIDIRAKQEIYRLFGELAAAGAGILWYSTELVEFEQCDRVYVIRDGRTVGHLTADEVTHERLIELSFSEGTDAARQDFAGEDDVAPAVPGASGTGDGI